MFLKPPHGSWLILFLSFAEIFENDTRFNAGRGAPRGPSARWGISALHSSTYPALAQTKYHFLNRQVSFHLDLSSFKKGLYKALRIRIQERVPSSIFWNKQPMCNISLVSLSDILSKFTLNCNVFVNGNRSDIGAYHWLVSELASKPVLNNAAISAGWL